MGLAEVVPAAFGAQAQTGEVDFLRGAKPKERAAILRAYRSR